MIQVILKKFLNTHTFNSVIHTNCWINIGTHCKLCFLYLTFLLFLCDLYSPRTQRSPKSKGTARQEVGKVTFLVSKVISEVYPVLFLTMLVFKPPTIIELQTEWLMEPMLGLRTSREEHANWSTFTQSNFILNSCYIVQHAQTSKADYRMGMNVILRKKNMK